MGNQRRGRRDLVHEYVCAVCVRNVVIKHLENYDMVSMEAVHNKATTSPAFNRTGSGFSVMAIGTPLLGWLGACMPVSLRFTTEWPPVEDSLIPVRLMLSLHWDCRRGASLVIPAFSLVEDSHCWRLSIKASFAFAIRELTAVWRVSVCIVVASTWEALAGSTLVELAFATLCPKWDVLATDAGSSLSFREGIADTGFASWCRRVFWSGTCCLLIIVIVIPISARSEGHWSSRYLKHEEYDP